MSYLVPKKIWELAAGYSSNVLCLCLTAKEAKSLYQRSSQKTLEAGQSAHRFLVDIVQKQDDNSKIINKFLQKKYQAIWRKARKLEASTAIVAFWFEQQGKEPLDALYWAVTHHPDLGNNTIENITLDMWLILARTHRQWPLLQIKYDEACKVRQHWQMRAQKTAEDKRKYQEEQNNSNEQVDLQFLQTLLEAAKQEKNHYQQQFYKMQKELEFLKNKLANLSESVPLSESMPTETLPELSLESEKNSAPKEQAACESQASRQDTFTLSGKSVLFIGGLRSQMPHFRQWIEAAKGQFLYHDGGLEDHYTHLQRLVSQADWVFCPLDCVSHNALQTAKKLCQRQDKPCIFLKKSSFSMFSYSVKEVSQYATATNLFSIREAGKHSTVV